MRETLTRIGQEFHNNRHEPFKDHPLANFVRDEAADAVKSALFGNSRSLLVCGSPGKGNFAEVPWIAIFDPTVTTSATHGYYIVYLFSTDGSRVSLSLNQGTTAAIAEYGARYREALGERARLMRLRLADLANGISSGPIRLEATGKLGRGYEAGHALGIEYEIQRLPEEARLIDDLRRMVSLYLALTFRGGLDPTLDPNAVATEFGARQAGEEGEEPSSVDEVRRYKLHMRIERNAKAARLAKRHHGLQCQACDFDFGAAYGDLGTGYIEVHHCIPLATLDQGRAVSYDVATDFAVLCANCHRMAHRMDDPSDIQGLRNLIFARQDL